MEPAHLSNRGKNKNRQTFQILESSPHEILIQTEYKAMPPVEEGFTASIRKALF